VERLGVEVAEYHHMPVSGFSSRAHEVIDVSSALTGEVLPVFFAVFIERRCPMRRDESNSVPVSEEIEKGHRSS
jgi:hypothetical protein